MRRTDLALEQMEHLEHTQPGQPFDGLKREDRQEAGISLTAITVLNKAGSQLVGKPLGRYITATFPQLGRAGECPPEQVEVLAGELGKLLPKQGACLVVGLGNSCITPDALGPETTAQVFSTRHIPENTMIEGFQGLRCVSAIAPGVLGQTGMEAGEIVAALVERTRPACVIAVDALAAGEIERLGCTVQFSDTGISPGSGVQNRRRELSEATLSVPVIAVGVPTVVDASGLLQKESRMEPMMVTPRNIDQLIRHAARLLSLSINRALQPTLSVEEIEMLIN